MTIKTRIGLTLSRNHEAMSNGTNLGCQKTEALYQIVNWHAAVFRVVLQDQVLQYANNCVYMKPRSIQNCHGSAENIDTGAISRFSRESGRVQFLDAATFYPTYVHPVQSLDSDGNSGSPTVNEMSRQLAAINEVFGGLRATKGAGHES
jgi:hypothetical protein